MARTQQTPPKDERMQLPPQGEVPPPQGPVPTEGQPPVTSRGTPSNTVEINASTPIPTARGRSYTGGSTPKYKTYSEILIYFDEIWGTQEGDVLNQFLINAGYVTPGAKVKSTFMGGYKDLIEEAYRRNIPMNDLLQRFPLPTAEDIKPTGTGTGGAFRSETESFTEYDATNVSNIANAAYRSKLGRNATKKEREILADLLNKEQRKNPQVTISEGVRSGRPMATADGQIAGTGGTVSKTTTVGGIDPSEIAQQAALEDEDYDEVFNRVVAFDLMKRILDRPV